MNTMTIESLTARTARHSTHYLAAGPVAGPLMIFVHGWPELSLSWRHQMPVFAGLGFRVIAPDMRGYGQSTNYRTHAAYAQSEVVRDMIELIDSLGREQAIWIGHDWGCATVWSLARLHPDRCVAVANLCVPGFSLEEGLEAARKLVDRKLYPEAEYPYGQWEYMKFYEEQFERATSVFDANPPLVKRAGRFPSLFSEISGLFDEVFELLWRKMRELPFKFVRCNFVQFILFR